METTDNSQHAKLAKFSEEFELWVLLEQTAFAIARARDMELNHYGLTPAQASVLYTLEINNGSATQGEISQFTMRQHHSVSTLINRMVKEGLVGKVKEPKGNKFKIVITEKGRNLYYKTDKSSIMMVFGALADEDRIDLAKHLKTLCDHARSLIGIDFKPPFLPSDGQ